MSLTDDEKSRVLELKKRAKRGEKLADFEITFVQKCYATDPKYFDEIEPQVFEETKPFGAA